MNNEPTLGIVTERETIVSLHFLSRKVEIKIRPKRVEVKNMGCKLVVRTGKNRKTIPPYKSEKLYPGDTFSVNGLILKIRKLSESERQVQKLEDNARTSKASPTQPFRRPISPPVYAK